MTLQPYVTAWPQDSGGRNNSGRQGPYQAINLIDNNMKKRITNTQRESLII